MPIEFAEVSLINIYLSEICFLVTVQPVFDIAISEYSYY